MIESVDVNKLKCGDIIEVEFGGFSLEGEFIRFHDSEIRFMTNGGSVVTTKPNKVASINGLSVVQKEGK